VVLRKHKPKDRKGKIVLVNASREFRKGNPKNHLTDDAVTRIAAAYRRGEPLDGLVAVIDKAKAEENDYNLSPSRYLANGDAKVMREIPAIVAELAALKKDEARLDKELAKVLAQL
ncbi:MAG: N-6 DNA methylase, partial [Metallibacterium sp.]